MLEKDNTVLFETEMEYTYPEYKKYYFYSFKYSFITPLFILLVTLCLALRANAMPVYIFFLIMLLIVSIILFTSRAIGLKWGWESKDKSNMRKNKYTFFNDRFEVTNSDGETRYFYYRDIYTIRESQKNLYIVISKNRFFVIDKQKCDNELLNLLRDYRRPIWEVIRVVWH